MTQTLLASLERTWNDLVAFAPALLVAILLMAAGWLVAKLARRIVSRGLRGNAGEQFKIPVEGARDGLASLLPRF